MGKVYKYIFNYRHNWLSFACLYSVLSFLLLIEPVFARDTVDVVEACVQVGALPWTQQTRADIAQCLGFQSDEQAGLCQGRYAQSTSFNSDASSSKSSKTDVKETLDIQADKVFLANSGRSELNGDVRLLYDERILMAKTAYIHRDPKTLRVTRIELLDNVVYEEPERLMRASYVQLSPENKTGEIHDVWYRFMHRYMHASLPAYGRADDVTRLPNKDVILNGATYTTCSPKDNAWMLKAKSIHLYESSGSGEARDAVIWVKDKPVLYTPYLTFPISKERKSGFLMPTNGYSNIGGGDFSFPYYWNIAPNYDATFVPQVYTRRGVMIRGDTRFLTERTHGVIGGTFLPSDRAFKEYIAVHEISYPQLRGQSDNRWSIFARGHVDITEQLKFKVNYQKISDDYFLQDFNNNMTVMTESQLLKEASLNYKSEHWFGKAMVQSYQTLNPINQSPVSHIYQRLPQIQLRGKYEDLPHDLKFNIRNQYDLFSWPLDDPTVLQGSRVHINPALTWDFRRSWGYASPKIDLVENYYDLSTENKAYSPTINHTIPRIAADTGLVFERDVNWHQQNYTQTFEPRLFYLYVPYQNQSNYPAFDSAYMIYRYDQMFRMNRFSGFDRISDGNQLAYAFQSRFLSTENGKELLSFSVGQTSYFANRQVQLCYTPTGQCEDNSRMLGYTSPTADFSPVTSVLSYHPSKHLKLSAGYVFDPYLSATNNADLNIHYEPEQNHIIRILYSYLVAANLIESPDGQENLAAEHQITFAYAWPFDDRWSSVGVFSYNISLRYDMVSFLGLQYESCCYAVRAFAGRAFNSLTLDKNGSEYNNSVYIQVLLKGLGTVSTNDPASTIRTYLPTYKDIFHRR